VVGHGLELRQVGGSLSGSFWGFQRKRDKRKVGEQKLLLPLPCVSREEKEGKKKTHSAVQNGTI